MIWIFTEGWRWWDRIQAIFLNIFYFSCQNMGWRNTNRPLMFRQAWFILFFHSELDQQYFTRQLRRNIWGQRGFVPTYICPIHKLINPIPIRGADYAHHFNMFYLIWKYSVGSGRKKSGKFGDSMGICPILHFTPLRNELLCQLFRALR